jgi:hypothetical protein
MGANLTIEAFGQTELEALHNLHSKLAKKYGGKIERDRKTKKLFVAANGSAHFVRIKEVYNGFGAYINL